MFRTSSFTNRSTSSSSPNPKFPNSIVYPPTPPLENSTTISDYISSATSPQDIPGRVRNVPAIHNIATPPLTPDSDGDDDDDESMNGSDRKESDDALDFLLTIFPRDGLDALPYARSVVISAPHMGATFDGVVLELPGKPKALYVDGKAAQSINLRERYVFSQLSRPVVHSVQHCRTVGPRRRVFPVFCSRHCTGQIVPVSRRDPPLIYVRWRNCRYQASILRGSYVRFCWGGDLNPGRICAF